MHAYKLDKEQGGNLMNIEEKVVAAAFLILIWKLLIVCPLLTP
jgi:hypothetical protein